MTTNQKREILQLRKAVRDAMDTNERLFNTIIAQLDRLDPPKRTARKRGPRTKEEWKGYHSQQARG